MFAYSLQELQYFIPTITFVTRNFGNILMYVTNIDISRITINDKNNLIPGFFKIKNDF